MRHRRFTIGGVVLFASLLAVPFSAVDLALTATAASATTINVPAFVAGTGVNGYDTGYSVSGGVSVSGSGTWCTNNVPADCNGPNGLASWIMAPNFLYQVAGTAFALVGRVGTSGPWTLVGTGPTTIPGSGELYLAMNDEVGQFADNTGSLQATFAAVAVPGTTPPVSSSVTVGKDAVWSVPIVNNSGTPLTNVSASLHARANGSTPLAFNETVMPGCTSSAGVETCSLPDVPPNSTSEFLVYVRTVGVASGATVAGDVSVSASGAVSAGGFLGSVAIQGCGSTCVVAVAAPGNPVASAQGPPTDARPTTQMVVLPTNQPSAPPVAITLNSINPGPRTSAADKLLCPLKGKRCSGQISVVAGDFSKYNDKANPVQVFIVAKWKTKVPPGRLQLLKPNQPPIQLATCVLKNGQWNTPCMKKEIVSGSAAQNNLTTITAILFVGADPHIARRASNLADPPTAVKATAAKKSAVLTWKAPVVTHGAVTGYLVTARIGKIVKKIVTFKGNVAKGTVTGLVPGKSYTFTIATRNLRGISLSSNATRAVKVTS